MATVVVAFDGTGDRTSLAAGADSNSNTNWGNFVVGGGAPSSEAQLAYQGGLAVNKKVTSTTARQGVDFDPASAPVDMTAVTDPLWFVKIIMSDSFDLNTAWGIEVVIGSGSTAGNTYNIAGSDANLSVYGEYPVQGGYLITAINPNITTWREGTLATGPTLTAIDYWAVGGQTVNGAAKNENIAMDAIDIGRGLLLTRGDGVDGDGTFLNFIATDQDTSGNRWGVVTGAGNAMAAHGLLTLGDSTGTNPTEFVDLTTILTFADGYHARGNVGVLVQNNNASDTFTIGNLIIGEGTLNGVDANDTRPDFKVLGTSGSVTLTGTLQNFRDVTYTSAVDATGSDVECHLLSPSTATIGASGSVTTIRTNSLADNACVNSFTSGTPDITFTDFIQSGAGHAILISAAGTYTFDNLTFDAAYGADDSSSSAIEVDLVSGSDVTINLTNTTQPTVDDVEFTGGGVVIFVATVTLTVQVRDGAGNPITGAEVAVYETDGTPVGVGVWTSVDGNGNFIDGTVVQSIGAITIRVRQSANTASFDATSGGVNVSTEVITTDANHKFNDGDAVVYDADGETAVTGITDTNTYFVNELSAATLSLHDTAAGAIANTGVRDLSVVGTGTQFLNPIRYRNNTASSSIAAANVTLTVTLIEDIIASDT